MPLDIFLLSRWVVCGKLWTWAVMSENLRVEIVDAILTQVLINLSKSVNCEAIDFVACEISPSLQNYLSNSQLMHRAAGDVMKKVWRDRRQKSNVYLQLLFVCFSNFRSKRLSWSKHAGTRQALRALAASRAAAVSMYQSTSHWSSCSRLTDTRRSCVQARCLLASVVLL